MTINANPARPTGKAPASLLRALASGAVRPGAVAESEAAALLAHCRAQTRAAQVRIGADVRKGRLRIARRRQSVLIGSLSARLVAAKEALKKSRTEDGSPPPLDRIWRTAEALPALGQPASPRLRKKMKARGGASRPICAFRREDKAKQHLLRLGLTPFASIHHAQFGLRRGRSAACESLLQAMQRAEPNSCVLLIDAKNFFGSISHAWLEDNLPLPKGVIRNLIHTGGMRITPTGRGLKHFAG